MEICPVAECLAAGGAGETVAPESAHTSMCITQVLNNYRCTVKLTIQAVDYFNYSAYLCAYMRAHMNKHTST